MVRVVSLVRKRKPLYSWLTRETTLTMETSQSIWNKRPNGPVSFTWFLPYIFLCQSMTKGCYTPNINAFRPVIHEKKMFQVFLPYKPI